MNESHTSQPDIIVGPREQLFHLLAEAAEIEHTLMCSYLFAAFSLRTDDPSLELGTQALLGRWRQAIISVAMDEMVHLLLVANLTIAIGGRPWFGRPNFPVAPGYFPSGVSVRLTRFSPETLDHLIFLERPQGTELPDGEGFEHGEAYDREEAYHGLMPSVQDYLTVGRLYEALRVNLVASVKRLGEAELFVGPVAGQVGPDVIDLEGVATIGDLASALAAIETIVEQGEGSPGDRADSHYQRFLAVRSEYQVLVERDPTFDPAWSVADNPVMRRPPEPDGKLFVDEPAAARVLDFANAAYGLLLRCLVQSFGRSGSEAGAWQAKYLDAAFGLMHVMGSAASALTKMRASTGNEDLTAGMTFTMLRSVEPMFGTTEQHLVSERLRELFGGARMAAAVVPELASLPTAVDKIERAFSKPL
ncbi:ferritin-like protein [Sphingomonas sp.]|uniref:ferritin-like domain-containing protein n=1 Tax=Sphingomonas sp. TaxID=28214 RepID=UPI0025D8E030|nr:ferritin-like protein [Sphingomonas sp.]